MNMANNIIKISSIKSRVNINESWEYIAFRNPPGILLSLQKSLIDCAVSGCGVLIRWSFDTPFWTGSQCSSI